MSWSGDLTPGLRRRRQNEKYVTDPSQLKLRFKRHSSSGKSISTSFLECSFNIIHFSPFIVHHVMKVSIFLETKYFSEFSRII